ncbi:uncharacterized protein LOC131937586 isoform X2 [Physella acuta]|uniref:uncharacterized protein LOC131937586 isoform X2 n=1 Tax=Physella acuta TaxID=109671 RepID=UPI0027DD613F|nr:uncharacterized protein LOC131937586 isoform X2 [Physella acuta]
MSDMKAETLPEHWSLFLRCTICFGYMQEPHTLECGHTFCKRCLKRLAEIGREDNPDVRVRRLNLSCPTCRHPFPAKPVLTDRICTCIILKQLVELWKKEYTLLAASSYLTQRSVCTQTQSESNVDTVDVKLSGDQHEEFVVSLHPSEQYCKALMKRVFESTDDAPESHDVIIPKAVAPTSTLSASAIVVHRDNISSDSESSVASENDSSNTSTSHSTASIPEMFGRMNLPRITFTECTPGRFLLMLVWCMYSVVIVGLAEAFLPYIILFTLFFFLVVLR